MWKMVWGNVRGTSHAQSGHPCQDYCQGAIVGPTLYTACADGAGTAELSHLGSKAAVDHFLANMSAMEAAPTRQLVETWVTEARKRVIDEAVANNSTPRQLACTLLTAIIGEDWAAFAQIGDGVIVFDGPEGYELAFWPDNGEYANTTRFLTDDDYLANLRVDIVERRVTELAVLTDGLQMLALDFGQAKVHDRFFAPLFRTLKNGPDEEKLRASLLEFMDSKRVNERTDDDKTLLLATRIATDVSPNLPDATA